MVAPHHPFKRTIGTSVYQDFEPGKDSQFWAMLHGANPEEQLKRWGAEAVDHVETEGALRKFMVLAGGVWWYAHSDGRSAYLALDESWPGQTGAEARATMLDVRRRKNAEFAVKRVVDDFGVEFVLEALKKLQG